MNAFAINISNYPRFYSSTDTRFLRLITTPIFEYKKSEDDILASNSNISLEFLSWSFCYSSANIYSDMSTIRILDK